MKIGWDDSCLLEYPLYDDYHGCFDLALFLEPAKDYYEAVNKIWIYVALDTLTMKSKKKEPKWQVNLLIGAVGFLLIGALVAYFLLIITGTDKLVTP